MTEATFETVMLDYKFTVNKKRMHVTTGGSFSAMCS